MAILNIIFVVLGCVAVGCIVVGAILSLLEWYRTKQQKLPREFYQGAATYIIETFDNDKGEAQESKKR